MIFLEFALYAYIMWVLFLAVMSLYTAWRKLPIVINVLAAPAALIAVAMDIGLSLIATLPFLDLPHELTFSQRMGRYKHNPS